MVRRLICLSVLPASCSRGRPEIQHLSELDRTTSVQAGPQLPLGTCEVHSHAAGHHVRSSLFSSWPWSGHAVLPPGVPPSSHYHASPLRPGWRCLSQGLAPSFVSCNFLQCAVSPLVRNRTRLNSWQVTLLSEPACLPRTRVTSTFSPTL